MRNVVVTGGTRGIGLAIAQALEIAGYRVIVIARKPNDAKHFVACDLAQIDSIVGVATELREKYGSIYGLVNNAGIGTSGIHSMTPDRTIAQVLLMNVTAPLILTKHLLRSMINAREGRIVNISSIVARTGYAGLGTYSASKAAIEGFTRALAREVGSLNITVNAVAPGFIATEMTHGLTDKQRQQIARRSALQRMAQPADVANAVAYLMSDGAANVTGTVMTVDAGNTA